MISITRRITGAVIKQVDAGTLAGAILLAAKLGGADLRGADLERT